MATLKIDLHIVGLDFPEGGCNEFNLSVESEYSTEELLTLLARMPEVLRNMVVADESCSE